MSISGIRINSAHPHCRWCILICGTRCVCEGTHVLAPSSSAGLLCCASEAGWLPLLWTWHTCRLWNGCHTLSACIRTTTQCTGHVQPWIHAWARTRNATGLLICWVRECELIFSPLCCCSLFSVHQVEISILYYGFSVSVYVRLRAGRGEVQEYTSHVWVCVSSPSGWNFFLKMCYEHHPIGGWSPPLKCSILCKTSHSLYILVMTDEPILNFIWRRHSDLIHDALQFRNSAV